MKSDSRARGFALTAVIAMIVISGSMFNAYAERVALYPPYESARQALLTGSLQAVKSNAAWLAAEAHKLDQTNIVADAEVLSRSQSLESARQTFAILSDAMIVYRNVSREEPRPAVAYCSMVKKFWLQPSGEIGNPYSPSMPRCGELRRE